MNAPAGLTINRLRCPLPARQPVVARLALEALAAEVADAPAALPPQSLLVIRQLVLEVPGLSLARLPDSGQRHAAGRGAGNLLADAWAQAARPAHGAVPPQATAVRFGDPAELLACIARDGLAGRLDRWWWRALLGPAFPDWRQAWATRPEAAPAALRLLAREGLASAVRHALDSLAPVAVRLVAGAAPQAPAAPATKTRPPAASATPTAPLARLAQTIETAAPAIPTPRPEPAAPALPLAPPQAQARPRLVSPEGTPPRPSSALRTDETASPATANQLVGTHAASPAPEEPAATAVAAKPPPSGRPQSTAPATPAAAIALAGNDATGGRAIKPAASETAAEDAAAQGCPAAPPPASGQERQATPTTAAFPAAARRPRLANEISRLLSVGDRPPRLPPSQPPSANIFHEPTMPTAVADDAGWPLDATPIPVRSRHARLFFLINVLLGDGLYPDFTQPAALGFPVPIWHLLALLGSGLAGPALRDDPLWPLLSRLADELPAGEDCAFRRDWPIPVLPQRQEAPRGRRPRQLPAAAPEVRPWALRHARPQGFARWLAAYRYSLRQRLAAALDVPPALLGRAFVQDDSAALIWVSAADIVVVQPLGEHPVAWRLAGLDRDPGFLPSAGRSLRFVFQ